MTSGLYAFLKAEVGFLEKNWPANLPRGVVHADLFQDNVFFLGDALSGFIDFYFACTDMLAYDLAICLNAWCFEKDSSFNITKARLMITAMRRFARFPRQSVPPCRCLPVALPPVFC